MVLIQSHKDFQTLRRLPFCYLCGQSFLDTDVKDIDHLPPRACFHKSDRLNPLTLPTHKRCNHAENLSDEKIGQIVSLLFGYAPRSRDRKLAFITARHPITQKQLVAITNVDLREIIWRWIRGFHAALYRELLHSNTLRTIVPPLQSAKIEGSTVVTDPLRPQDILLMALVRQNRLGLKVDKIVSNSGKLNYFCMWTQDDSDRWFCAFALDIYGWRKLGERDHLPQRNCVGAYFWVQNKPPIGASTSQRQGLRNIVLDGQDVFRD